MNRFYQYPEAISAVVLKARQSQQSLPTEMADIIDYLQDEVKTARGLAATFKAQAQEAIEMYQEERDKNV